MSRTPTSSEIPSNDVMSVLFSATFGSYPEIRQIWVNHLYENWNDDSAWENGEDYQPEA
jgi:hypothetical protein